MVNFVNKVKQSEEIGLSISHFYNIDHRLTSLICMCGSTATLLKTAILPNILLIWLPWQPYMGLILWEK